MKTKRLEQIKREIGKIKEQLQKLEILRPGSLTQQYRDPKRRSGAFYQLSYTRKGRSKTEYVRRGSLREIRKQVQDHRHLKILIEKWIALGIEYSQLTMKLEADRSAATEKKQLSLQQRGRNKR